MKYNCILNLAAATLLAIGGQAAAAEVEEGFTPLMDGKSFDGWKKAEENPNTWKIEDGAFVANGERCHLF